MESYSVHTFLNKKENCIFALSLQLRKEKRYIYVNCKIMRISSLKLKIKLWRSYFFKQKGGLHLKLQWQNKKIYVKCKIVRIIKILNGVHL